MCAILLVPTNAMGHKTLKSDSGTGGATINVWLDKWQIGNNLIGSENINQQNAKEIGMCQIIYLYKNYKLLQ